MSNRNRAVPVLLTLFLLLGCADDHRVAGPDETLLPEVLASTSSATEYEVVRLTYPFEYPLFGIDLQGSDVASWTNNGNSMNDDGWITGRVGTGAAAWDPHGVLTPLDNPAGRDLCHGAGINQDGHVVGSCWDADWTWGSVPVFWFGDGTAHPLSMKVGEVTYFRGSARAINDDKRIAGFLYDEDDKPFAVVWSGPHAHPVRLPELEPVPDGRIHNSHAHGINSRGDIVGHSNNQAAVWLLDEHTGEYEAIALPYGDHHLGVRPWSINDDRDIVAGFHPIEPYEAWQAPWQPILHNSLHDVRLWLHQSDDSWLTLLPEDMGYRALMDINDRENGVIRVVGTETNGWYPRLWTFDTATGRLLAETHMEYPSGWHWHSRCLVRAANSRGLLAGNCREEKGRDLRPWEIVVWRPLGDPSEPPPPPPPSNDLEASFEYSCGNTDTCQFRCTSTGAVDSRSWTFANGNPSESDATEPVVQFVAGDHLVTLTVADAHGGKANAEATVKCSSHPRHGVRCR